MNIFQNESSYVMIPLSNAFDILVQVLDYYKRDYDILEEPLGIANGFC